MLNLCSHTKKRFDFVEQNFSTKLNEIVSQQLTLDSLKLKVPMTEFKWPKFFTYFPFVESLKKISPKVFSQDSSKDTLNWFFSLEMGKIIQLNDSERAGYKTKEKLSCNKNEF